MMPPGGGFGPGIARAPGSRPGAGGNRPGDEKAGTEKPGEETPAGEKPAAGESGDAAAAAADAGGANEPTGAEGVPAVAKQMIRRYDFVLQFAWQPTVPGLEKPEAAAADAAAGQ